MIKIIYGVNERISSDCGLIFPQQDTIGLLNLVQAGIIKNDVDEAMVGMHFFSIHCPGDFFVFSKVNIVKDRIKRVSHCAFMLAAESKEKGYYDDILSDIKMLEQQYADNKLIQSHTVPNTVKIGKDIGYKQTVAVYYHNEDELREYFEINENYKQYAAVYFIDIRYQNRRENPLHVLKKYDKISEISELKKSHKVQNTQKKPRKIIKITNKHIVTIPMGIALICLCLIIGIAGGIAGTLCYQKYISNNNQTVALRNKLNEKQIEIDYIIRENAALRDSISKISNPANDLQLKTAINPDNKDSKDKDKDKTPVDQVVSNFLKTDCKKMTLIDIQEKIKSFKALKVKNLYGFANFITLIAKNPPTKQQITDFVRENQINFNDNDEYVKFVKYLNTLDADFLKTKNMFNIYGKTLEEIEKHYGFSD